MARLDDWQARFSDLVFQSQSNPEGYSDEQIENAFSDVDTVYKENDAAKMYAVAHWLESQTPGGESVSESFQGNITSSKKPISKNHKDSFWATTSYGVKFLTLRRSRVSFSMRNL